jgi:hypothetical protein
MAPKQTGSLRLYKTGWHGRYWAMVDGVRKRVFVDLHTEDKGAARIRLGALMADAHGARAEHESVYARIRRLAEGEMSRESTDADLRSARMVLLRAARDAADNSAAAEAKVLLAAFLALGKESP